MLDYAAAEGASEVWGDEVAKIAWEVGDIMELLGFTDIRWPWLV